MAADGTLLVEDTDIMFRNFAGHEGMYNREGDRNFCLPLDDDLAERMTKDGWNVKRLKPGPDGELGQAYIQVSLKYRGREGTRVRPPTVAMITSLGRTVLDEDMVDILDMVDIEKVDLIVRPYQWAVNGNTGTKAYLQSLYVTIREDYLQLKYNKIPEVGSEEAQKALESGGGEEIWDADVVAEYDGDDQLALESGR